MIEVLSGIHKTPYSPHLGDGWHDIFAGVNSAKADVFDDLGVEPGDFFLYEGRIFQAVRTRAALAAGELVKRFFGGATRSGTVAASPTPTTVQFKTSFNLVEGDLALLHKRHPVLINFSAGTAIGQTRRIKDNTGASTNLVTLAKIEEALSFKANGAATDSPDALDTAPASGDAIDIIVPWEVTKHAAAADFIQGVALGTVDADNYTIIGVAGPFDVKCVGSTDALVAGSAVVPSGTAGQAKGPLTAGMTAVEASRQIGWAYAAYSGAAANRLCELFGNTAR